MLQRWLSHPLNIFALTLIGLMLVAPSLNSGYLADDFFHWARFTQDLGQNHRGSPWDLFSFMDGNPAHIQRMKESGDLVWWASNDLRVNFWRPLSEWSHWIDHRLWPDNTMLQHAHNLLWYAAVILLLGQLYKMLAASASEAAAPHALSAADARLIPGLATLLFVLCNLHFTQAMWIAARNQLLAGVFTLLCVMALHRWQARGERAQGWLAGLCMLLALLSAEAGVGVFGYVLAYALVMLPGRTLGQRVKMVLPFVLILVGWRLCYSMLEFGTTGSGYYVDPVRDPLRFLGEFYKRLPALTVAYLMGTPASAIGLVPLAWQPLYAAGIGAITLLFWLIARAWGVFQQPVMRFLALGALFCLIPMCASEPADRLLLNFEFGMGMPLAWLFTLAWRHRREHKGWLAMGAKVLVSLAAFSHLVFMPAAGTSSAVMRRQFTGPSAIGEPLSLPDPRLNPQSRVVVINPPIAASMAYTRYVRQYFGRESAISTQGLANGLIDLKLKVRDAQTVDIEAGPLGFHDLFTRDLVSRPFTVGQPLPAGAFTATVLSLNAQGQPLAVRFRFDVPLNDPTLAFYRWDEKRGFVPFNLPAAGQDVTLAAADVTKVMKERLKQDWPDDVELMARGTQLARSRAATNRRIH